MGAALMTSVAGGTESPYSLWIDRIQIEKREKVKGPKYIQNVNC